MTAANLSSGDGTAHHEGRTAERVGALALQLCHGGAHQTLDRPHVGGGPASAICHLGPGGPVRRVKPGGLAHQRLGPGCQVVELPLQVP